MINEIRSMLDTHDLSEVYDELLEKSGYMDHLKAHGREGKVRIENVLELKSSILEYCEKTAEEGKSRHLKASLKRYL